MTTRAVAQFFSRVENDAELAGRVAMVPASDKGTWASEVVAIARSAGFDFEPDEIDAAVAEQQQIERELGEDDLERVAGGSRSYNFYEAWPCKWYVPDLPGQ